MSTFCPAFRLLWLLRPDRDPAFRPTQTQPGRPPEEEPKAPERKLHECQLSEREETKELHKESRGLLNKLAACRQVACPMCDAWKAEVEKVNQEKARLEKLVFQKKKVSRFASPCANSSLLYCR